VGNPTEGGGPLNREEIIKYWITGADSDYQTMVHLYESKDYHWSLFMGHLVLEKIFKAIYVQNVDRDVPRTHDLLRLSQRSKLDLTDEQKDLLDLITSFNIAARYPDYKQSFYKKCTSEFTQSSIRSIEELRKWLLTIIIQR
jgi:HEPN domain-containing protein